VVGDTAFRFSDFDEVGYWVRGVPVPDAGADDRTTVDWDLAADRLDARFERPLFCTGVAPGRLQGRYLWQLANVKTPRRTGGELEMPVWVRYFLEDRGGVAFDPRRRLTGLNGPVVVERNGTAAEIEVAQAGPPRPRPRRWTSNSV